MKPAPLSMAMAGVLALTLGFSALVPVVGAQEAAGPVILGRWLTEPRDGIIEIARTADGGFEGKIIGGNDPHRVDAQNPDASRRQQLLLGQLILAGMHQAGPNSWAGGTIYDPDGGHTYKCRIEPIDHDHLKVRGFIGFSMLGRSQSWTRYLGTELDLSKQGHEIPRH